jgi:hypothetical protein
MFEDNRPPGQPTSASATHLWLAEIRTLRQSRRSIGMHDGYRVLVSPSQGPAAPIGLTARY